MARDLHDEVNQALTAILLRLEALAYDSPPERAHEVAELKRLALQAMDELLSLARQLRPTALDDHGLVPADRGPDPAASGSGPGSTPSGAPGRPTALDEERQTVIYRVAQEALANAGRHAHGRARRGGPALRERRRELRVRDDGRASTPSRRARRPGSGGDGRAGPAGGRRAGPALLARARAPNSP